MLSPHKGVGDGYLESKEWTMHFDMKPVPKARNLDQIAQNGGYLLVQYKGKSTRYVFGPNIEEGTVEKLLRVPYPDSLLCKLKKHWKCHKIGA